jgi:hypothetical protein
MEIDKLIGYAQDRGIELSITPDLRLEVEAPKGMLTPEVIRYLRGSRPALIDKLCDYQFQEEVMRIIFPDDVAFVVKQVRYLSGQERLKVVKSYLEEFDAGFKNETNPARKRNAGGYRANVWLREKLKNEASDDQ